MPRAHEWFPFISRYFGHELIGKTERIIVIADKIEIAGQRGIVDTRCRWRNDIMRHPLVRRGVATNGRYHDVMKAHDLFRSKAPIGQAMCGVRFADREKGQIDLVKMVIFHRPEHITPRRIQRRNRAITLRTISPESFQRRGRCAHGRIVAAQFIVGLPTGHMRMTAITRSHGGSDTFRLHQICFTRKVIMAARSETTNLAGVDIDRQNVGIFFAQPFGRRCSGRAKHDFQSGRAEHVDRAVHPCPIE